MDGLAPNLSKYDSKLLPSVRFERDITSNSGAVNAGVCFWWLKSLGIVGLKV